MSPIRPDAIALTRPLPPLPRTGARRDGLSAAQRRALTAVILALHVALIYGLLQVQEVRDAAREVAPMFVDLIAPPAPPAPPVPAAPPPVPRPVPKPPPPAPVIVAATSPAPAAVTLAEPPAPVIQAPAPPAPPAIVAPAAPAPVVAAAPPRVIPASDVAYLEKPGAEYPRLSIRNHETGRVIVLVLIDERGLPQQVQIAKSSGFTRLDNSALTAVRQSRFKPPTDMGRPTSGWANLPFDFELEK